jgi:hypothetical protein
MLEFHAFAQKRMPLQPSRLLLIAALAAACALMVR